MEDRIVNCKNCKYFIESKQSKDCIHYSCQKNNSKTIYPKILGLMDNCPISLRQCYTEKGEDYGTNSKARNH